MVIKRLFLIIILVCCVVSSAQALQKNIGSQKWGVFCFDETDITVKTGDAANILGIVWIDGTSNAIDDTNPTELARGMYLFDITAAETNGNYLIIDSYSSTANIQCVGMPPAIYTSAPSTNLLSIDSNGRVDVIKVAGTTQTANDIGQDTNDILTDTAAYDTDAEYATAIWNAATASYGGAGTYGQAAEDILISTNSTQTDLADGGRLDLILDELTTQGDTNEGKLDSIITAQTTAQNDLDIITGADGVTLATAQGNYAPAKAGDQMDLVNAPNGNALAAIQAEMEENGASLLDTISDKLPTNYIMGSSDQTDQNDDIAAIYTSVNTTIPATITTMQGNVTDILADTNELQTDWTDGGRLDLIIDAILEDTGTTLQVTLSTISTYVDTEVAAILSLLDDARAEPGQGAPAVNADAMTKLDYLYKAWRNKTTQTATETDIYNDAGAVVDQKSTVSDDGVTFTRDEWDTGP